jgi:hypothetical protein
MAARICVYSSPRDSSSFRRGTTIETDGLDGADSAVIFARDFVVLAIDFVEKREAK